MTSLSTGKKVKLLDGMSASSASDEYPKSATPAELFTFKEWKCESGTDLARDKVIRFKLTSHKEECVRVSERGE